MSEQVKDIWKRIVLGIFSCIMVILGYNVMMKDGVTTIIPIVDTIKPTKTLVDTTNTIQYVDTTQTNE